jgi:SAM-dependent methyltransferase
MRNLLHKLFRKTLPKVVADAAVLYTQSKKYECPCCKSKLAYFEPLPAYFLKEFDKYQFKYSIFDFETLNIFDYACPVCGVSDRERMYALYLDKKFANLDKQRQYKFLDFAPNPFFSNNVIKSKYPFINYRSVDLYSTAVDDTNVDIQAMVQYENNSVDFFICSHILEHVLHDEVAMKELYRILHPNGFGIVMVPILPSLAADTESDTYDIPEAQKWHLYGQYDHIRQYSKKGFMDKLQRAGFKLSCLDSNYFGIDNFTKHGIHKRSVLYVVEK